MPGMPVCFICFVCTVYCNEHRLKNNMTPYEPRHEKICLGTDHLIFLRGGGWVFFSRFSSDRKTEIFFSQSESQNIFFQDKAKTKYFFLNSIMLEMYSFRFIRSCISWTQYTWVYFLYVRVYMYLGYLGPSVYDPRHDKTSKMAVRPAKTQISLGIRPVWSESSLSAWRSIGSLATHWAHSEDSDPTGRMLIRLGAHSFCWFCHVVAHKTFFLNSAI